MKIFRENLHLFFVFFDEFLLDRKVSSENNPLWFQGFSYSIFWVNFILSFSIKIPDESFSICEIFHDDKMPLRMNQPITLQLIRSSRYDWLKTNPRWVQISTLLMFTVACCCSQHEKHFNVFVNIWFQFSQILILVHCLSEVLRSCTFLSIADTRFIVQFAVTWYQSRRTFANN